MARRERTTSPTTESATEAVQSTEENVVTDATEATPEATADTTETTTEAPAVEAPIDTTAFEAALAEAVEQRDETTGELPTAALDPVQKAYRALDGAKAKAHARKVTEEAMRTAMNGGEFQKARAYMVVSDGLTSASTGGGTAKAKEPVDPTEAFVQKAAGLRLAVTLVGDTLPEGVAEDWADKAKAETESQLEAARAYLAWTTSDAEDKGEAPETPAYVVNAVKLALGKSAKVGGSTRSGSASAFTGERRDIGKHIAEAFAEAEVGTFLTVAEIGQHKSSEYGDDRPSAGAISARLFPKSGKVTVEGIEPGTNADGKKGARKVA